jgi:ATP-dependent helicase/nuclease subunit B
MRLRTEQPLGTEVPPGKPQTPGSPRIYTVPPGEPFLIRLAEALIAGHLPHPGGTPPGPMRLADVTLLLPTRRATRALQQAFLKASRGAALLLPRVRPIFAVSEEVSALASLDHLASDQGDLRPAIGEIERQLALTKLVLAWAKARAGADDDAGRRRPPAAARTAAQARLLARELGRLMDAMEIADIAFGELRALVPDAFAEHWQQTLAFLTIATEHWPAHLSERGLVSAVAHDKSLIRAQIASLRLSPPAAPVIVAGVMSSIPIVTELLAAVAGLPNGALVLPALDQALDEESWQRIVPEHPEHPQFGLKRMLDALGIAREQVACLPGAAPNAQQRARAAFLSEVMRPAQTTERWRRFAAPENRSDRALACAGITTLNAPSAEDEAEAIALILRQALETPARTAALVSPDGALARRVAARLAGWGVDLEDSAGRSLATTGIGTFLELTITAAASRLQPVALMALLQHPFCRAGMAAEPLARARRTLELAVFRAPYFGQGLDDLGASLNRAQGNTRARPLAREDWRAAAALLAALRRAFGDLDALLASAEEVGLARLVAAHVAAVEALASGPAEVALWQGRAGEEAAKFLAALIDGDTPAPQLLAGDYADFYRGLARELTLRETGPTHPLLAIHTPYESRLLQPDIVVLGALNEGVWPEAADAGPWLSRPMRKALGLPALEERIGDAAHIFASLLGAKRVYLTRAVKVDGVPTVPSRWLLRMEAVGNGADAHSPEEPWLGWAQARNAIAGPVRPQRAPEPRPPVVLRPRRLSVTSIETWLANPYAIFARRILALQPLPSLGRRPDAALRGQIVHAALGRFARRFPERLPSDARAELIACAEAALRDLSVAPRVAAFWAPRFARFAAWFAETEPGRRAGTSISLAEIDGSLELAAPAGPFMLTARADRIDVGDKGIVISDYKGGANIKERTGRALEGLEPQLPLEAAIAAAGGFPGIGGEIADLRLISTSGGEPPGAECSFNTRHADLAGLAHEARAGLVRLIGAFDLAATPYSALRRPRFSYRFDDFAHLARVAEWSLEGNEEA